MGLFDLFKKKDKFVQTPKADATSSVDNYIHTIRSELIRDKIISNHGTYYEFDYDYVVNSPSTAVSTLYYGNKSGKEMWKRYEVRNLLY